MCGKPVCEVFLLRFVAIARHGNVFSGGNEGERWRDRSHNIVFLFSGSEARLCNVVFLCEGKPGNIVVLRRGC